MTDAYYEGFHICDDRITENDRCVIKIIGIHYQNMIYCRFLMSYKTIKVMCSKTAEIPLWHKDHPHYDPLGCGFESYCAIEWSSVGGLTKWPNVGVGWAPWTTLGNVYGVDSTVESPNRRSTFFRPPEVAEDLCAITVCIAKRGKPLRKWQKVRFYIYKVQNFLKAESSRIEIRTKHLSAETTILVRVNSRTYKHSFGNMHCIWVSTSSLHLLLCLKLLISRKYQNHLACRANPKEFRKICMSIRAVVNVLKCLLLFHLHSW